MGLAKYAGPDQNIIITELLCYNSSIMDTAEPETGHLMLIMWDMYGVEAVIDVTAQQQNQLFDMIRQIDHFNQWLNQTIIHLTLRARANSQRNYEVFSIWVDESVDADTLRAELTSIPQIMADLVRSRGNRIFGSANPSHRQVIS